MKIDMLQQLVPCQAQADILKLDITFHTLVGFAAAEPVYDGRRV